MSSRKRIKVAVVGVGYLGRLHAQKYASMEEAELIGVVDASPARAAEIAREFNTKAFGSHTELFGQVQAVSVVTPTEHHFSVGMDFLSRGVHVMMEKPITTTVAQGRALVDEAKRNNLVLQVGHLERYNGAMYALGGRVCSPVFIEAFRISPFPNRSTDVDVILDLMIHDIDLVLSFAGSEPESITATGVPVVSNGKADFASARVRFKNGCVASLTASRVSTDRARKINIYQPGEVISIDYGSQALSITRAASNGAGQADEKIEVEKKDAILEELRGFLASISTGCPAGVSGEDGLRALELAERIQESCRASAGLLSI